MMMEAEIGVMCPQATARQGLRTTTRCAEAGLAQVLLLSFWKEPALPTLGFFKCPASRTEREYISTVLSLPVCSTLLWL